MFRRRNKYALFHQAGGITDLRNIAAAGFHFKAIKVGATKNDAAAGGGRKNSQLNRRPAMEADAAAFGGISSCSFVDQKRQTDSSADFKITSSNKSTDVVFLPQLVSEKALFRRNAGASIVE